MGDRVDMNDKVREAFEAWINRLAELYTDWWDYANIESEKFYPWQAYLAGYLSASAEIERMKCCGSCKRFRKCKTHQGNNEFICPDWDDHS